MDTTTLLIVGGIGLAVLLLVAIGAFVIWRFRDPPDPPYRSGAPDRGPSGSRLGGS